MTRKARRRSSPFIRFLKILYWLLFAVSLVVVGFYIAFKVKVKPPAVPATATVTIQGTGENDSRVITLERKEQFYTFLLMGSDDGNGNADTIMVGSFDIKNNQLSILSVPRDTLVDVSRTVKKINAAYGAGGVGQLLDELQSILGFRPDHYIKVDIQAFVQLVDLLDGVTFDVPCDMYHDDGAGFIINLKAGSQWLDGQKALQLVRFRGYPNADLGRIQTQQQFLKQIAKQTISISNVTKINEFAHIFSSYLDTDLSVTELAYFGVAAMKLDFSTDVSTATLPGDGTVNYGGVSWYYQLYPAECLELVNQMVNPYTTDIILEMTHIFQVK